MNRLNFNQQGKISIHKKYQRNKIKSYGLHNILLKLYETSK